MAEPKTAPPPPADEEGDEIRRQTAEQIRAELAGRPGGLDACEHRVEEIVSAHQIATGVVSLPGLGV